MIIKSREERKIVSAASRDKNGASGHMVVEVGPYELSEVASWFMIRPACMRHVWQLIDVSCGGEMSFVYRPLGFLSCFRDY